MTGRCPDSMAHVWQSGTPGCLRCGELHEHSDEWCEALDRERVAHISALEARVAEVVALLLDVASVALFEDSLQARVDEVVAGRNAYLDALQAAVTEARVVSGMWYEPGYRPRRIGPAHAALRDALAAVDAVAEPPAAVVERVRAAILRDHDEFRR
jgi:hypothetical protein